ncbi:MAG: glycosyl transferase [Bacteroidales bacterium]|nr:glycosyl transferase [Bacteroidales bacterium]
MIPKMIHYCWFGGNPLPSQAISCIESWKKFLPDYQIKEWNEQNFDIESNEYVKQAYSNRKFAFVTDYVRLYALYNEGGIYMDTDVEVLASFDKFLHHHAFSGFETDGNVPTGMMAAERGSVWAKELLDGYKNRSFVKEDGTFDMTTNTKVITEYMVAKGLKLNNKYQDFEGLCTMYPAEYFCPKDHRTGKIKCTSNSVCIHHFAGSWIDHTWYSSLRHKLKVCFVKIFGESLVSKLSDIVTLRYFRKK